MNAIWLLALCAALEFAATGTQAAENAPDAPAFLAILSRIAALPRLADTAKVGALLGTTFTAEASPMQPVDLDCATLVSPNIPACSGNNPVTATQIIHYRPGGDFWLNDQDANSPTPLATMDFITSVAYHGDPPVAFGWSTRLWFRNLPRLACITEDAVRSALKSAQIAHPTSHLSIRSPSDGSILVEVIFPTTGARQPAECAPDIAIVQQTEQVAK
jgi:hypothetical protein